MSHLDPSEYDDRTVSAAGFGGSDRYVGSHDWTDGSGEQSPYAPTEPVPPYGFAPGSSPADGPVSAVPDDAPPKGRAERRREAQAGDGSRKRRTGRNMPAAIGVGVALAAAVLASLFVWRPAFLIVVALAVGVGVWEMARAVGSQGARPPLAPLIVGGVLMTGLAWWGMAEALTFGLIVTVLAVMIWRLADGSEGYERDVTAATLIAVYVPFLAGYAVMLARPDDGALRVVVALACVVLSDTGGFVAGVFLGKHPMAPTVSPKKSWEGLAGSMVATAVGASLLLYFLFDARLWQGAVFGLCVAAVSVLGDLAESLIKRDLGVKDMSNLLPGHGGIMDRLDSVLFAAPAAFALFALFAPAV
jgi:phosphatidate cytidylyltransferase